MKNIIDIFLDELGIRHTYSHVHDLYEKHPYKNNLYGLSLMLTEYSVKTQGVKISSKDLDALSYPCILHIDGDFIFARGLNDGMLEFWENSRLKAAPQVEVEARWDGCALIADYSENACEPDYMHNRTTELIGKMKKLALYMPAVLLIVYVVVKFRIYEDGWLTASVVVSLIGIFLCVLLLQKQVHSNNSLGDKICSVLGDNDCGKLLNTKSAKLFWGISWSEVGMGFFVSYSALMLFNGRSLLLYVLSFLAVVFSIWSIWYQFVKSKQKCTLCLCVQAVVLLNALFLFLSADSILLFGTYAFLNELFVYGCSFVFILLVVNRIASLVADKVKENHIVQELSALKYDDEVFLHLLKKQSHYEVSDEDSKICFGDRNSPMQIIVLSNPHCRPCALMHERLKKLMARANRSICIRYIFSYFSNIESNKVLIDAYLRNDENTTEKIYDEWFDKGKVRPKQFMLDHGLDIKDRGVDDIFDRHERWRKKYNLYATPTVLVNGYLLPSYYKVEDLLYFKDLRI